MSVRATTAEAAYGRAIDWWTRELAGLMRPSPVGGAGWRASVVVAREGVALFERRGQAAVELWRSAGDVNALVDDPDARRVIDGLARRGLARGPRTLLRLDPRDVVATRIRLPEAVRPIAGKVIANRLELLAPWPAERATFSFADAGVEDGHVVFDVVITDRQRLDGVFDVLKSVGLEPGIVDAAAAPDEAVAFNLHRANANDDGQRQRHVARGLAALGIATLATVACLLVWERSLAARSAELGRRIQVEFKALRPADDASASTRQRIDRVLELRRTTPSLTVAIEALSRRLPDDVVLDRLDLRDGLLTLTGKGDAPHTLIAMIEAEPLFKETQFAAPTTRAAGEPKSSFTISTRLQPQAGTRLP